MSIHRTLYKIVETKTLRRVHYMYAEDADDVYDFMNTQQEALEKTPYKEKDYNWAWDIVKPGEHLEGPILNPDEYDAIEVKDDTSIEDQLLDEIDDGKWVPGELTRDLEFYNKSVTDD